MTSAPPSARTADAGSPPWSRGPAEPPAPRDDLHLWLLDADRVPARQIALFEAFLTTAEKRRVQELPTDLERHRFTAIRALSRVVTASYPVDEPALSVVIASGDHDGSLALVGVAAAAAARGPTHLGLDLREAPAAADVERLADGVCSPGDRSRIDGDAGRLDATAVLRIWSAKEAIGRASGTGIDRRLQQRDLFDLAAEASSGGWVETTANGKRLHVLGGTVPGPTAPIWTLCVDRRPRRIRAWRLGGR